MCFSAHFRKVTIHNIPNISDVAVLIDLLKIPWCKVEKINESSCSFTAENVDIDYLKSDDYNKKLSGSGAQ